MGVLQRLIEEGGEVRPSGEVPAGGKLRDMLVKRDQEERLRGLSDEEKAAWVPKGSIEDQRKADEEKYPSR